MSHAAETQSAGPTSGSYEYPSAWVGWIAFAGVIMIMLGLAVVVILALTVHGSDIKP